MPLPLSADLRRRILNAVDGGQRCSAVAARFAVSSAAVRRLVQRRREGGETTPRSCRRHTSSRVLAGREEKLKRLIEEKPDRSAAELHKLLGVACSEQTVRRERIRLGYRFKKSP